MIWIVSGAVPKMRRSIENTIRLFYGDLQVRFAESVTEDGTHHLDIQWLVDSEQMTAIVKLEDLVRQQKIEKEETVHWPSGWFSTKLALESLESDIEQYRLAKQTMLRALFFVLQEDTGIEQPWGILSGIRPTKLLHTNLREGMNPERTRQQLRDEWLISNEKINLMQMIVHRQQAVVPDLYELNRQVSIYIGIPFCPTKCAYCTFPAYAIQGKQGSVDSFLKGLHYEMKTIGQWLKERNIAVTTVYFGGGTPTSITAEEMDELYALMYTYFPNMDKVREITVEAGRPDTITEEKLKVLKKWNIDRISINPQSYTQSTLNAIGRHHTVEQIIETFQLARQFGMDNINMDLIIGLPGEGVAEFEHTLMETAKLMPDSLTVHTLSYKRASEMTSNKQKYPVADRHVIHAMMKRAEEWTAQHGYQPYYLYRQKNILGNLENVGYAKPGKESIYNIMIMEELQTIIGLGCGAASKWVHPDTGQITRFANPKEPKAYSEHYQEYTHKKIGILDQLFHSMPMKSL